MCFLLEFIVADETILNHPELAEMLGEVVPDIVRQDNDDLDNDNILLLDHSRPSYFQVRT
jgi:hypothetical protein